MNGLIESKYKSLFIAGTTGMIVEYAVLFSDNIIAGQIIGETGLAALSLVAPLFNFTVFVALVLGFGAPICMSTEIGRMNRHRANEYFSNALFLCFIVGGILSLLAWFFKDPILAFMGVPKELYQYTSDYYKVIVWLLLLFPLNNLLCETVISEGYEMLTIVASVVQMISNIVLSTVLCLHWGIIGIAIGTIVSVVMSLLILSLYFLRKDKEVKIYWYLSLKDFWESVQYCLSEALVYLYLAIFTFIGNAWISYHHDSSMLAVFCIVINMQALVIAAADGCGNAIRPLITVFSGEGNTAGIKRVMKIADRYALWCGIITNIIMFLCAGFLVRLVGVDDPALVEQSIRATRIFSVSSVFFSIIQLYTFYYIFVGAIKLSTMINTLQYLVLQPLLFVMFGVLLGMTGGWIGMAISPMLSLLITVLVIKYFFPHKTTPLLLDKTKVNQWGCFETNTDQVEFMKMVEVIETFLRGKGIPNKVCLGAALLVEEISASIREKNGNGTVRINCSVFAGDRVELIFLDDGAQVDLTDTSRQVTSLQTFLSTRLIERYSNRAYLRAINFNRLVFRIPIEKDEN